jgi:hypothetical protein
LYQKVALLIHGDRLGNVARQRGLLRGEIALNALHALTEDRQTRIDEFEPLRCSLEEGQMNSRFFVGICVSRHPVKKYSVNMAKQNMAIKQILLLSLQFYESKAAFRHILPSHEPGNGVSNLHKRKPWCLFRIHSLCLANQTPLLEPES